MGKIVIERTVKPTCSDFDKKNSYFLKVPIDGINNNKLGNPGRNKGYKEKQQKSTEMWPVLKIMN